MARDDRTATAAETPIATHDTKGTIRNVDAGRAVSGHATTHVYRSSAANETSSVVNCTVERADGFQWCARTVNTPSATYGESTHPRNITINNTDRWRLPITNIEARALAAEAIIAAAATAPEDEVRDSRFMLVPVR